MLEAVHALLHLKPIVDADLPHCPVLVFPSWEKSLEEKDTQTIAGISQLFVDFCAKYVNAEIATIDDARKIVWSQPEQFMHVVDDNRLFVAPGGSVGEPVADALNRYEKDLERWRTSEWLMEFQKLSPAAKVMNGLFERLTPQYHLLENSAELKANPLLCIEQQAHYFKLLSGINNDRLQRAGLLNQETQAIIAGLGSDRLAWLSNIPIDALVELRSNNENEAFRKLLADAVSRLHDASIEDTDRVAAEICREIDSGIAGHNRLLRDTSGKYYKKAVKWAAAATITGLAAFVPSLAPYLGAALPLALAGKLGWDVWGHSNEQKRQSRSLMGVLAVARSAEQ
jgi:hypothetical protein